jgi:hypothetical protein
VTVAAVGDDRVELTGHVQPERHLQRGTGMTEPGVPEPGVPEPGVPEPGVPEPGVPEPGVPDAGVPDADEFRLTLAMTPSCPLPESVRNRPELDRPPVTLIGFRPAPWLRPAWPRGV